MRALSILAVLLVSPMLGCAGFEHPLSPLDQASFDDEVHGSWVMDVKDEAGDVQHAYVHIGKAGSLEPDDNDNNFRTGNWQDRKAPYPYKNFTRIVTVSLMSDGEVKSDSWLAFPTKIGDQRFASVPNFEDGKIAGYIFWMYEIEGNHLKIWTDTDSDDIDQLLESGVLKRRDGGITNDTDALRKLVEAKGGEIFFPDEPKYVLRRLKVQPE